MDRGNSEKDAKNNRTPKGDEVNRDYGRVYSTNMNIKTQELDTSKGWCELQISSYGKVYKPVSYTHLDVYKRQGYHLI